MSFNFNFKSNAKIEAIIQSELTNREITDIDMIAFGNIIMNIAKFLSKKVNDELLEPISCWLDDPEWLKRFQTDDKATPNWTEYKRKQRQWTQQQKAMATERLRLYGEKYIKSADSAKSYQKSYAQIQKTGIAQRPHYTTPQTSKKIS